jgi:hypothetical protein
MSLFVPPTIQRSFESYFKTYVCGIAKVPLRQGNVRQPYVPGEAAFYEIS